MKRVIMVGHVACGKTTLSQRLNGLKQTYQKTQALEFLQKSIDTPGEYLERRSLVHALMVTSVEADVALFIHDATAERFMFAPGLAGSFPIPVIGVVNKIDCATPQQRADARELLELTGASPIFEISAKTGEGMQALLDYLSDDPAPDDAQKNENNTPAAS